MVFVLPWGRWPSSLIMSGGWGGFEGGWLGQSLLGRSWNSEGRRARPGLGLQEHWGCGPCVQLAWLGRFQCAASRTLPLLWWLLHARLAGFEQVSPTSRGQCQSLWERLSECPWTASSGPHGSVLQPAVLHTGRALVDACPAFSRHDQPSGVVTYGALWRYWACLSAQGSRYQGLCPAISLWAVCEDNWGGSGWDSWHASDRQSRSRLHIAR